MPRKRFGQHFLSDPAILDRIVTFSGAASDDAIVEVGPGRGALTLRLARDRRHVTAVEIDRDLAAELRKTMPPNVEVIEQDALTIDFMTVSRPGYLLVSNLPYNIATPLVERFVAARARIRSVTVMVQKEVAERILGRPGSRQYGPLSVGLQYYATVEPGFVLPPGAFHPPPRVHSQVLRLDWKPDVADNPEFVRFVRGVFGRRRKKLINNLAAMGTGLDRKQLTTVLDRSNVDSDLRPEDLSIADLLRVFRAMAEAGGDRIRQMDPI